MRDPGWGWHGARTGLAITDAPATFTVAADTPSGENPSNIKEA